MQEINVNYYEVDGENYVVGKKIEYNGSTYVLLVNENDYTDSFLQKENGDNLEPVEDLEILHKVLSLMTENN